MMLAQGQSLSTPIITPLSITLFGSDIDSENLTYTIVDQPENASLEINGNLVNFVPNINFTGDSTFTYQVTDEDGNTSQAATILVEVFEANVAPFTIGQSLTTLEDIPLPITLVGFDGNGDTLSFALASGPQNGILTGTAPNLIYTPNDNFNGEDSFTYTVGDGVLDSTVTTVNITVTPLNDLPVISDIEILTPINTPVTISLNAIDDDHSEHSFVVSGAAELGSYSSVTQEGTFIYTPNNDVIGVETLYYTANDGTDDSERATITIQIGETIENAPPVVDLGDDMVVLLDEEKGENLSLSVSDQIDINDWQTEGDWVNLDLVEAGENLINGEVAFGIENAQDGRVSREFDLSNFATDIERGSHIVEFSVFSKSRLNASTLDEASVEISFYEGENLLVTHQAFVAPSAEEWNLLAIREFSPASATRVVVSMIAEYGLFDSSNDVTRRLPCSLELLGLMS